MCSENQRRKEGMREKRVGRREANEGKDEQKKRDQGTGEREIGRVNLTYEMGRRRGCK